MTGPFRVLIIDDVAADAALIARLLRKRNHTSGVASTLRQGMTLLKSEKFDAVLVDLGLPDSSGMVAVQLLCNTYPKMPIIVVSGIGKNEQEEEVMEQAVDAIRHGAQDYLVKNVLTEYALDRALKYSTERAKIRALLTELAEKYRVLMGSSKTTAVMLEEMVEVSKLISELRHTVAGIPELTASKSD